ncbi:transcription initiation factor IIB [Tilletia horrida]|uniref:Transcription initiation factor IIB n=1 Tax=Tilletia horrida TaxID=155126 RepID=A0AAN6GUB1_9BASI|nr:transcription initiation factor IIB [Tilletia horrida]KAK0568217.1 transcription initiation factor IIB [Tilletia horrida]
MTTSIANAGPVANGSDSAHAAAAAAASNGVNGNSANGNTRASSGGGANGTQAYVPTTSTNYQPFAITAHYTAIRSNSAAAQKAAAADDAFAPNLNVRLICPDCKIDPPNLEESFATGDLVCTDCGMVVGDRIVDTRSEWRTFANEDGDDPSRVGQATNPLFDGLTDKLDTRISFRDGGSGTSRDLQRTAQRMQGTRDRHMLDAFEDIQRKCDSVHLPRTVSDIAKQAFRRCEEERILKGKRPEAIIAAAIYVACKMAKVPRTFSEICALTSVNKKMIGQCFKEMQMAFGLNATGVNGATGAGPASLGAGNGEAAEDGAEDRNSRGVTPVPGLGGGVGASDPSSGISPTGATDLVGRFCNHLGLDSQLTRLTELIAIRVRDLGTLAGRSPITIAAACIYFATQLCNVPKGAKRIGKTAAVSDATIKNSYKELFKHREDIVTDEIKKKGGNRIDMSRLTSV